MRQSIQRTRYILTLQCEEASQLASDALDRPLCWYERLALAGHRLTCRPCRRLKSQLLQLRDAIRAGHESGGLLPDRDAHLRDERKQKIHDALRDLTTEEN